LHFIIYVPALCGIVFGAALLVTGGTVWWVALLFLLGGMANLGARAIKRWTTEIAVTSERVVYKTGLIRRDTIEMGVRKVESVLVHQSSFGRMFGFGTVIIRGTGQGIEPLHNIAEPLALRRSILEAAVPKSDG
jgi:uncharacterized membrane protein YdbT with pleckstrin-like domain